jgi:tetratricopeptide (TPR) repeat protein
LRLENGDIDGSIVDLDVALSRWPTTSDYVARGRAWLNKGDADRARSDFSEAARLSLGSAIAVVFLGATWELSGDFDRAISDYSKAVLMDPKNAIALVSRGEAWMVGKGDYERAATDFRAALVVAPRDAWTYKDLGYLHLIAEDYESAAKDFEIAHGLSPDASTEAWLYIARARARPGDSESLATALHCDKEGRWPAAVLCLFRGEGSPDAVLASDAGQVAWQSSGRRCGSRIFIGEWQWVHRATSDAISTFTKAQGECPHIQVGVVAREELKHLKRKEDSHVERPSRPN